MEEGAIVLDSGSGMTRYYFGGSCSSASSDGIGILHVYSFRLVGFQLAEIKPLILLRR